jgi:hypothetical protein
MFRYICIYTRANESVISDCIKLECNTESLNNLQVNQYSNMTGGVCRI